MLRIVIVIRCKEDTAHYMQCPSEVYQLIKPDQSDDQICGPAATRAFTSFVTLIFCKVLDESAGEVFAFSSQSATFAYVSRGSRIFGVNARKPSRNFEVEVRDLLCRCV